MAIPFEQIEEQKENIRPLKEGRSAASLVQAFSKNHDSIAGERAKFEEAISQSGDLDDPIQPYLDYINWTKETYPQGDTQESGLIPLLEATANAFKDARFYHNDPRYLKVWMMYARLHREPRDVFVYLARNGIGAELALYYEEFAAFLESTGCKSQADEVYMMGINANARPSERLARKYSEFRARLEANPPSEDEPRGNPIVRPALAQKAGDVPVDGSNDSGSSSRGGFGGPAKVEVFSDPSGATSQPAQNTGGWDSIGTLASRRKENVVSAVPWAGQKLEQSSGRNSRSAGPGLSVYKDPPPKKGERTMVAMEFVTDPDTQEEYCLEEILARSRKIYGQTFPDSDDEQDEQSIDVTTHRVPRSPTMTLHTKAATDEVYEMFNEPLDEDGDDTDHGYDGDDYPDEDMTDYKTPGMHDLNAQTNELSINDNQSRNDDSSIQEPVTPMRDSGYGRIPVMTPIAETTETQSTVMSQSLKNEPIVDLDLVNPTSEQLRRKILDSLDPSLEHYPSFYPTPQANFARADSLKKANLSAHPIVLEFPTGMYCIRGVLGEGGFGIVFLAESSTGQWKAVKMESGTAPWEFYILRTIQSRIAHSREIDSIVDAESMFSYADESYLILDYLSQGTILDAINAIHSGLPECVAMFFTIELLRTIESLHDHGIIHGDIKPDNVMLRLNPIADHQWSKYYDRHGRNGWGDKGIVLIDFGRAMDLTKLRPDVRFISDWKMDNQDCIQMQQGKPWTYDADYYGIAAIVHLMLFGQYIKTEQVDGQHRITSTLKRYWQRDLWEKLLSLLINPGTQLPITHSLRQIREEMCTYLENYRESGGVSLKGSIRELEDLCKGGHTNRKM